MNSANPSSGTAFAQIKPSVKLCAVRTPRTIALIVLACVVLASGLAQAQNTWIGTAGTTNWTTPGNWSLSAPPADRATPCQFDNITTPFAPAGVVDNIVDANFTISALQYQTVSTNGYHTTLINPGLSLNINGAGGSAIQVGNSLSLGSGQNVYSRFSGPGTLTVTNTSGAINVMQFGGGDNDHRATLDLSGLTNFIADVDQVWVATTTTTGEGLYPMGSLILAENNLIHTSGGHCPAQVFWWGP